MRKHKYRCAIYTRKSSEDGLNQSFNSLHAQREACEAYIKSQASEGWTLVGRRYDDGGLSGGNMERDALKTLLADIKAGLVDIVLVYKIDRLTRSLSDFSKMVDVFDQYGVTFISVTQSFNTTTSMGRLTLNMLLSFAQFEREVTGERIRDKISASKAKGMWMGGTPPLGYGLPSDNAPHILTICEEEASKVKVIFSLFCRLRSVTETAAELRRQDIRPRNSNLSGSYFTPGSVSYILRNPIYCGIITHKGKQHEAAHQIIIDKSTFALAQSILKSKANIWKIRHKDKETLPLEGSLLDPYGRQLSPRFGYGKSKKRYGYYISTPAANVTDHAQFRIPRGIIEQLVLDRIRKATRIYNADWNAVRSIIRRVRITSEAVHIILDADAAARKIPGGWLASSQPVATDKWTFKGDILRIVVQCRPLVRGGRTWLVDRNGRSATAVPAQTDIAKKLSQAHFLLLAHNIGAEPSRWISAVSIRHPRLRRIAAMAFLAPDLQLSIVNGTAPAGLSAKHLLKGNLPLAWADQRPLFVEA